MTARNTYHRQKHGSTYPECRECIRLATKKRSGYGYTRGEQKRLSKHDVIVEDTSNMTACPKCSGVLIHGNNNRLEDGLYCLSCGWRPSAIVGGQA